MKDMYREVKENIRTKVQAHRVNKIAVKYAQAAGEWQRAASLQSLNCYNKRDIRAFHMMEAFLQNKPFLSCEKELYNFDHPRYCWQNSAINTIVRMLKGSEDAVNFKAWTQGKYMRPVVEIQDREEERVLEMVS